MIIGLCVYIIHHQARVLSLTGMLNSAAMASIYFFLLNELVIIMVATFSCWICSTSSIVNRGVAFDST